MKKMLSYLRQRHAQWNSRRQERLLSPATLRHERLAALPGDEFSDAGGGLDKVRFLRRQHMFVDWSSWHSALRDD